MAYKLKQILNNTFDSYSFTNIVSPQILLFLQVVTHLVDLMFLSRFELWQNLFMKLCFRFCSQKFIYRVNSFVTVFETQIQKYVLPNMSIKLENVYESRQQTEASEIFKELGNKCKCFSCSSVICLLAC